MRHLPEKPYNGLTVVLAQPSRRDDKYLISGDAGIQFNEFLQKSNTSRWACDIRLADSVNEPLLKDTKGILLLGEPALHTWCPKYLDYKLTELRGTPLENRWGLPCICSFTPQDSSWVDRFANNEKKFNPLLKEEEFEEEKEDEEGLKKRHGATQRKNFRFWLGQDIQKILYKINGGEIYENKFDVRIYPRADEVIHALSSYQGEDLFYDIETDSERNLTVVGFSNSNSNTVYSLPIIDYTYNLFYGNSTFSILSALVNAQRRCCSVIHNSMFDLFVQLWKYKLPIGRKVYDTMLSQARIYPDVEKSLGHSLSCHPQIWVPFHKDEGIFEPKNHAQERQLLEYNAKDVIALRHLKRAQLELAKKDEGLLASINQANNLPYAFLINSLTGMKVDKEALDKQLSINDRYLNQLLRVGKILTGPTIDVLPSSSQSCVKYFHHALGYPIVGRSKKTNEPSLDETNLLKLKQKNPLNVMIDLCIKYRGIKKFSGSLKAEPLKGWHET